MFLLHSQQGVRGFRHPAQRMALFATSLNLLVGYTGMVSFGHGMFYGLGAYTFALLMQSTGLPLPVGVRARAADHALWRWWSARSACASRRSISPSSRWRSRC